jgi:hypothetical protein
MWCAVQTAPGHCYCGKFRHLNLVAQPDSYTLPNMLDFANMAAGCKIFSKMYLRKGYHQVPMHPEDICKTVITTPFGFFKYTKMPFSLCNASNTFQRKIDRVRTSCLSVLPSKTIWRGQQERDGAQTASPYLLHQSS